MKKIITDELEEVVADSKTCKKTSTKTTSKSTTAKKTVAKATSDKETEKVTTTRRRRTSTAKSTKSASTKSVEEKNPFTFSLNTAESLLEITANDDIYEVYATNDEYVLFLGKNSSYFSSAQDNLSLKTKSSQITISKVDDVYKVSTNLDVDISDNVAITNFGKSKDSISFSTADSFKISGASNKLSITAEVYNKNKFFTNLAVPNASNNCLIISDEDQKVYLPYSFEEVDKKFNSHHHSSGCLHHTVNYPYSKAAAHHRYISIYPWST